jgi:hypothetical protein
MFLAFMWCLNMGEVDILVNHMTKFEHGITRDIMHGDGWERSRFVGAQAVFMMCV